jgi:hypothetical protein
MPIILRDTLGVIEVESVSDKPSSQRRRAIELRRALEPRTTLPKPAFAATWIAPDARCLQSTVIREKATLPLKAGTGTKPPDPSG